MVGFEPTVSCSQGRRISRLSYIPRSDIESKARTMTREGVEPSSPP